VLAPCREREREREREKNEKRGREMDTEGQMVKNDLYMGDIFPPVAFFFFWRATERERERERGCRLCPIVWREDVLLSYVLNLRFAHLCVE
jgi:hypothetical protein